MIRVLDLILSITAVLFFLPILIPVAFILKCTGEREVFFYQERVGKNGNSLKLIKFATILRDSPNIGTGTVTLKNDPRVLPFGRFLRASKINELPQLLNVIFGDMSLIGPRPQTKRCFDAFKIEHQNQILSVKPGLSGIGSIIFRNEEAMLHSADDANHFYDTIIMAYKGQVEEWYVQNISVLLYVKLIVFTIIVVLKPDSTSVLNWFPTLPKIPDELKNWVK